MDIEIDQQSHIATRKLKIRKQLSLMNRQKTINGFDFHDHLFLDEQIKPITAVEFNLAVNYRQWFLLLDLQAVLYKFKN